MKPIKRNQRRHNAGPPGNVLEIPAPAAGGPADAPGKLSPALKRWLDRVIVPNLVDAYLAEQKEKRLADEAAAGAK